MPRFFPILILPLLLLQHASGADPETEKEEESKPVVEQISENEYKLGEIRFNSKTREIRLPAVVNAEEGILEYVLVHEQGKTHESLFRTAISPTALQIVLKLLRYESGKGDLFDIRYPPGEEPPTEAPGSEIDVFATWPGTKDVPVGDLILDALGQGSMKPQPWIYTGSEIQGGKFQAEIEGSIIGLYLDPLAMLNTRHARRDNDENWFPIKKNIPAYDTPVTVILRPAQPEKS